MFRKIVSNLSLSPSAGSQLTFYLRRLQKEGLTRKLSLVFAMGLVALQIATIVSPASAARQPSPNDIIYGGLAGTDVKADLLSIYDQNHDNNGHVGYQRLFTFFGITRAELAAGTVTSINSGDHSLYSLGRTHQFADDFPITLDGQTYYLRHLFEWGDHVTYPAITGTRADGSFFAVMVDCGNIVVKDVTVQTPTLSVLKGTMPGTPVDGAKVPPGATLGYRIYFANSGQGAAHNLYVEDPLPAHTTFVSQGSGGADGYGVNSDNFPGHNGILHAWWGYYSMPAGAHNYYVDLVVKVNADTPNGTQICNVAFIRSSEQAIKQTPNKICQTVVKTAPPPPPPPPPPSSPHIELSKAVANLTKHVTNASGSTAGAGDTLQYTLTTKNTGHGAQSGYVVNEDISDILAYADVTEADGAQQQNGHLIWPATNIAANSQLVKTFTVQVKSPIPATPSTLADPRLYDLKLDNIYGNAVEVKLQIPPAKVVEQTAQKLPQTGSGSTGVLTFVFVAMMVYFFLRNRQLVKELKMLRVDNVTGA